jgi:hypothetical protein
VSLLLPRDASRRGRAKDSQLQEARRKRLTRKKNKWRNDRAVIIRWQVILDLGGACEKCGCYTPELLEVDHPEGRSWPKPAREYNSYTRARMYQEELRTGIPLRVLCKSCNGGHLNHSKYQRRKRRNAR